MKRIIKLFVMTALLMLGGRSFAQEKHEYVDLGLPSGTLWATCNLGANAPEEYGDYFAWGETQPKDNYDWSSYKYADGALDKLTKYCYDPRYGNNGFTDNLNNLEPTDDAATANWGDGWCIPTVDQWRELLLNTTQTWMTMNAVYGWLFTASNGNSIFMPAAGFRKDDTLRNDGEHGDGNYMSSTLYDDGAPCNDWSFHFPSGRIRLDSGSRRCGQSVRPVRSSR